MNLNTRMVSLLIALALAAPTSSTGRKVYSKMRDIMHPDRESYLISRELLYNHG